MGFHAGMCALKKRISLDHIGIRAPDPPVSIPVTISTTPPFMTHCQLKSYSHTHTHQIHHTHTTHAPHTTRKHHAHTTHTPHPPHKPRTQHIPHTHTPHTHTTHTTNTTHTHTHINKTSERSSCLRSVQKHTHCLPRIRSNVM
jgi:hypothetical protein